MYCALSLALLAALVFTGYRSLGRSRLRRELAKLPGASVATALPIEEFSAIEDHLSRRHCPCGGTLRAIGERSERDEVRLLRVSISEFNIC